MNLHTHSSLQMYLMVVPKTKALPLTIVYRPFGISSGSSQRLTDCESETKDTIQNSENSAFEVQ